MSPESRALLPLAESIADGSPIDWEVAETHVTADERAVLRELRVLANLAELHRSLTAEPRLFDAAPKTMTTPATGTWGHLDLLERLGGGTSGEVYRAWDRQLERDVALKLLRMADAGDARGPRGVLGRARAGALGATPGALQSDENPQTSRISMEGRLLARLRHPNVITVYGVDVHDGRVGLWMELVRGATLEQIVQQHGPFSAREAALIGIDLCHALAAVHGAGLIHRDVKAQNVMRESGGRIVLMDLGTGRESGPAAQPTTGDLAGTPLYLAPEIFDGAPANARTDLYSLGVLLYRLVTGAFPARATTMDELRAVHAKRGAIRLRDARADLPTPFVRVIERALDSDPGKRYESAGGMEADLARVVDELSSPRLKGRPWRLPFGVILAILAIAALGGTFYWTVIRNRPESVSPAAAVAAPIRSIAVLPLANLTGDAAQEYFVDGMTDELISTLGRIEGLDVISRTSVIQFKNPTTSLTQIAQALKVDAILEGSVLFVPAGTGSGNAERAPAVRINARLLRAGTDRVLMNWTTFETVRSDVLSLQSRIATAVAEAIKLELTSQQQQSLAAPPQDPDSFDLYLRGRYYWNLRSEEGLKRSIQYFREAIDRDPRNAAAYAGLADAYSLLGIRGFIPRATALQEAYGAASKALAIDSSVAEAHASIALVHMERLEWETAEAAFKLAIKLKPGYASAYHWYSAYLSQQGRLAEARTSIERAVALDPLSPSVSSQFGGILLLARQYDAAIAQLHKALQLDPKNARPHMYLAESYAGKGDYAQALAAANTAVSLSGGASEPRAYYASILGAAGRRAQALEIAEDLAERYRANAEGSAVMIASIYAGMRDNDRAFEWLERALSVRDPWLGYIKIDPRFDALRADPRLARLLASLALAR